MKNLFFPYRKLEKNGKILSPSPLCVVEGDANIFAIEYLRKAKELFPQEGQPLQIQLTAAIPQAVKERAGDVFADHPESYAVVVNKTSVTLYGATPRGLLYAAVTLVQLVQSEQLTEEFFLFDYPDKDVRGYRVYTPGRAFFSDFKAMIDQLVDYKYNTVMIEVGGAMEYKRRPEINQEWVKFCKELSAGPDIAQRIQNFTYPWRKDSIHFDNGNGGFITQNEMRELIDYCRRRELTVIPEVPSLSHSDYIVRAYPELNERVEDAYPDTYCPSNPKTYEVLFDVLDEVIEVFEPESLNIGHDEYYTSAKCPRCRGKNPVDLYTEDILKLHGYLTERNIKTVMWGEKLFGNMMRLNSKKKLVPCGGAAEPEKDVPALYLCREKLPADITLLHWCWPMSSLEEEQLVHDLGHPMLYGNFSAVLRKNYRESAPLYSGGFASNWGSCEAKYLQRNMQNFDVVNTAYAFWSPDYDDADAPALTEKVRQELYARHKRSLGKNVIEICHTTELSKPYEVFYDGVFIVDSDWLLGHHTVTYTDGTVAELPIIYGYNIRGCSPQEEPASRETIGAAYPFKQDGMLWYRAAYQNPHPEKEIASIETHAKGILVK